MADKKYDALMVVGGDRRMPLKGYYLCSSACHSAHGMGPGSSCNCDKLIAKDLGLSYERREERGS